MPQKDQFSYIEAVPNSLIYLFERLYVSSNDVPLLDEWAWKDDDGWYTPRGYTLGSHSIANLIAAIVLYELGYD